MITFDFLREGALSLPEIQKYDWRIKLFLKKYQNGESFETNDGSNVVIEKNPEVEKAIKSGKQERGFKFKTKDGKEIGFNNLKKTVEFGGGTSGSGVGAKQTAAAESAQCVYAQCIWDNPNTLWSVDELKAAHAKVNVDTSFEDIMALPEVWRVSSIRGAEILKRALGRKKYKWYRGEGIQKYMEKRFKELNNASGRPFNDVNKWSPADIWIEAVDSQKYDWESAESITSLNNMLLQAYANRDVMGISLKKITGKKAKVVQVNYKKPFKEPKFKSLSFGKRDYWKAKDGYIMFQEGEIQFRTFPTFQAEIIGKAAKHGKVSGGQGASSPMGKVMKLAGAKPLEDQKQLVQMFRKNKDGFMKKWYDEYNKSPNAKLTLDKFKELAKNKDDNWAVSKYLVTSIFNSLKGKEQKFLTLMFRFASSQSANSAVHLKVK